MRNGLESMRKRMEYLGTSKDDKWGSDGRIVKGKLLSFYDALNNSYQAALESKASEVGEVLK